MAFDQPQRLHWTQRVALVRHNLHSARRTNDFSFFKSLQAHALIEGTDHVALLYSALGDNADSVLSTLDNLNAGIAYVHQDAFKAVYDGVKSAMHDDQPFSHRRSLLRVDVGQQRDMADHAIDKTTNSAVNLIQAQPVHCQDAVANAWVTGTTIMADAVCVCLNEMAKIEDNLDDFIRLEYSWNSIQSSVDAAISALRGIFSLMAIPNLCNNPIVPHHGRNLSVSSASSDHGGASTRSRSSSTASAFGFIKRALSHSQIQSPPATKSARSSSMSLSISPPEANPRGFRASMSAACPTKMSTFGNYPHTILTTIPPTPAVMNVNNGGDLSPFKQTKDYFAFDIKKKSDKDDKEDNHDDDLMHLESLDPLYSPPVDDAIKTPVPMNMRSLPESFDIGTAAPIAV
ncbi:Nn.00g106670.m01.CDS01 [Neocucurbitaria sp. VM-36]